jgi:DNA-directed RNA polymerase subunit RPC12/RpoP
MPGSQQKGRAGTDPYICDKCHGRVNHENWIGIYQGAIFIRKGYECPHCGFKSIRKYDAFRKTERYIFDWRKLEAPTAA